MSTILENESLRIRNLTEEDASLLAKWLTDERVLEFYEGRDNPHDLKKVKEVFFHKMDRGITPCIIEYNGLPIGYLQFYPSTIEDKEQYNYPVEEPIYGMDQFIGEPEFWNRGIGSELVSKVGDFLIDSGLASRVIMDPQARNERAIRCYEKCGFVKVKYLPEQELHEGVMQDCWLMEYKK
ncbi:acetyltransferase [Bacillus luteolus]|uniref:Acetyltransferase n=1 Tax=Litchfieldia luteola TaxID=682179 RepID=A0ABR9QQ13_9BACI|nr:GNAT family N-acetyltransferase [Cytobacillus luteolus]MBE4910600.1 acetyltransferase [Cytobacillus luteolus]MBP1943778.1 aminoglycoside 6'-N-acetyltransferase [Cytobacillus luteolus]